MVAAVAAPVLLLADEQWLWGGLALLVGALVLAVLPNALFRLGRRWAVLVPAGFVIVDPMTLADPVLFLREHVVALAALDADGAFGTSADADATVDLDRDTVVFESPQSRVAPGQVVAFYHGEYCLGGGLAR